jgi:hypothetical protein
MTTDKDGLTPAAAGVTASEAAGAADGGDQRTANATTVENSDPPAPASPSSAPMSLQATIVVAVLTNLATVLIVGLSVIVLREYVKLGHVEIPGLWWLTFSGAGAVFLLLQRCAVYLKRRQLALVRGARQGDAAPELGTRCCGSKSSHLFIRFSPRHYCRDLRPRPNRLGGGPRVGAACTARKSNAH